MSGTLTARLLLGDGGIDLIGNIRALDSIGCTAAIGVEIYSSVLDALPPKEAARRVAETTRRVLSTARSEKASPLPYRTIKQISPHF
jgi:sugar phosphate isomerase/epimerase